MKKLISIIITVMILSGFSVVSSGVTRICDDFDPDTWASGNLNGQGVWVTEPLAGTTHDSRFNIDSSPQGGGGAVQYTADNTSVRSQMKTRTSKLTGDVVVEAAFYVPSSAYPSASINFYAMGDAGTISAPAYKVVAHVSLSGGFIRYYNDSSALAPFPADFEYQPNNWYTIKMVIHTGKAAGADYYINGTSVLQNGVVRYPSNGSNISGIDIYGNTKTTNYYVDNIKYYQNQPPTATFLKFSGQAKVGETISGTYTFSDPDTDMSNKEGNSKFAWYYSNTEDGALNLISGANKRSFTPNEDYEGKFLVFSVIPADENNMSGEEIKSPATEAVQAADYASIVNLSVIIKGALTGGDTDLMYIEHDLNLPGNISRYGFSYHIDWISSNEKALKPDGRVVPLKCDTYVTLTAVVSDDTGVVTRRDFKLRILANGSTAVMDDFEDAQRDTVIASTGSYKDWYKEQNGEDVDGHRISIVKDPPDTDLDYLDANKVLQLNRYRYNGMPDGQGGTYTLALEHRAIKSTASKFTAEKLFSYEFKIKNAINNKCLFFLAIGNASGRIMLMNFTDTGISFTHYSSKEGKNLYTTVPWSNVPIDRFDQWFTINLLFDTESKTFDCIVNGETVTQNVPCDYYYNKNTTAVYELTKFEFGTPRHITTTNSWYLDNICLRSLKGTDSLDALADTETLISEGLTGGDRGSLYLQNHLTLPLTYQTEGKTYDFVWKSSNKHALRDNGQVFPLKDNSRITLNAALYYNRELVGTKDIAVRVLANGTNSFCNIDGDVSAKNSKSVQFSGANYVEMLLSPSFSNDALKIEFGNNLGAEIVAGKMVDLQGQEICSVPDEPFMLGMLISEGGRTWFVNGEKAGDPVLTPETEITSAAFSVDDSSESIWSISNLLVQKQAGDDSLAAKTNLADEFTLRDITLEDPLHITGDLYLPTTFIPSRGGAFDIAWQTDYPVIISADGAVKRPKDDKNVTLTAIFMRDTDNVTMTREYKVRVLKDGAYMLGYFDDLKTGTEINGQSGWTCEGNVVVSAEPDAAIGNENPGKTMLLRGSSKASKTFSDGNDTALTLKNNPVISFKVWFDDINDNTITVYDESGGEALSYTITNAQTGCWLELSILINNQTGTYSVFEKGVPKALSNALNLNTGVSSVSFKSNENSNWHIDDVCFSEEIYEDFKFIGFGFKSREGFEGTAPSDGGTVSALTIQSRNNSISKAEAVVAVYVGDRMYSIGVCKIGEAVEVDSLKTLPVDVKLPEENSGDVFIKAFVMQSYTTLKPLMKTSVYSAREHVNSNIVVYIAGDSTACDYNDTYFPQAGWGQMLCNYFNSDNVTVSNHAVGGRSSKSFIDEGRLDTILSQIKKGDYLLIQFAHNDDHPDQEYRYTIPETTYKTYLMQYVNAARLRGATPVIMTSVPRRKFTGGVYTGEGDLLPYTLAARQLASEMSVPFIDVRQEGENLLSATGEAESAGIYMNVSPNDLWFVNDARYVVSRYKDTTVKDNTHLSLYGADVYAGIIANGLKTLSDDLGRCYVEYTPVKP